MRIQIINLKPFRLLAQLMLTVFCFACSVYILTSITFSYLEDKEAAEASNNVNEGKVIIIDAGHGGEDSGAIGVNGVLEKDLNLEISMLIGEELKRQGFTVVYTRTTDTMLYSESENVKGMRKISDLRNRVAFTQNYKDATFISIHMNSFGAEKYSGLQVYYKNNSKESEILASLIQSTVKNQLQQDNNRVIKKGSSMFVLDKSCCNAVLIECGFLTNNTECEKLSQKEYQKQLSFSIVCGIIEYINQNERQ